MRRTCSLFMKDEFRELAELSKGRPKGVTPAFLQPDGEKGPLLHGDEASFPPGSDESSISTGVRNHFPLRGIPFFPDDQCFKQSTEVQKALEGVCRTVHGSKISPRASNYARPLRRFYRDSAPDHGLQSLSEDGVPERRCIPQSRRRVSPLSSCPADTDNVSGFSEKAGRSFTTGASAIFHWEISITWAILPTPSELALLALRETDPPDSTNPLKQRWI